MDSSPIGSWLLTSYGWQIQQSVEGFSQAARVLPAQGGSPGPQRRLPKSFDRLLSLSNEGWIQQSIGESIEYPTTFNQTIEDLLQ